MATPDKMSPFTTPSHQVYNISPSQPFATLNSNQYRSRHPDETINKPACDEMVSNNVLYNDFIGVGGVDPLSNSVFVKGEGIPESFNPRLAQNMSHKEKVPKWIETIPMRITDTQYVTNCFPAILDDTFEDIGYSHLPSSEEILEVQARKITFLSIELYAKETEDKTITPEALELAAEGYSDVSNKFETFSEYPESYGLYRMSSTPRKRKTRKQGR